MNWRASQQRPIQAGKQLLVEGRTAEIFFREWVGSTGLIGSIDVRDFGSIANLTQYLLVFSSSREFRERVTSLGIIRDAESDPATAAFQSVCESLHASGLTYPKTIDTFSDGMPRTGVFVLPDCNQPGMLETLCWQILQADASVASQTNCVTTYLDCVRQNKAIQNEAKARVWTYLAGMGEFDPLVGRAAQAKIWNWTSPALTQLSSFLHSF